MFVSSVGAWVDIRAQPAFSRPLTCSAGSVSAKPTLSRCSQSGFANSPFFATRRKFVAAPQQKSVNASLYARMEASEGNSVAAPPKPNAVIISDKAMNHLLDLKNKMGDDTVLRMGVRQGGCSGMSYDMNFVKAAEIRQDDRVYEYESGFRVVVDPKSLMFLFGMMLDYSDALIGGGFNFQNPNANSSCGCGKSFSA